MGTKAKILRKLKGRTITEVWLGEKFTYDWPTTCESDRNNNIPISIVLDNGALLLVYGQIHWESEKRTILK